MTARSSQRIRIDARRGATLVEAAVVVAIVAVLAAVATPSLQSLIQARRLDATATQLAADIQLARSQALARHEPVRLSLPAGAGCWVIHTGGPAPGCTVAEAIKSVQLAPADGVRLASNAGSLLFDPVLGTSTPTATLRLADPRGREVRHVVNVLGRTRSCATDPSLPAYRPC